MRDIIIDIIVPIFAAILGFLGGCKYTRGKQNSSSIGKNSTNNMVIQDSHIEKG